MHSSGFDSALHFFFLHIRKFAFEWTWKYEFVFFFFIFFQLYCFYYFIYNSFWRGTSFRTPFNRYQKHTFIRYYIIRFSLSLYSDINFRNRTLQFCFVFFSVWFRWSFDVVSLLRWFSFTAIVFHSFRRPKCVNDTIYDVILLWKED